MEFYNSNEMDNSSIIRMTVAIMNKSVQSVRHFDTQANILIGISMAIFAFSATQINNSNDSLVFYILAFFSGVSAMISIYSIYPPKLRKNRENNLIANGSIVNFDSSKEYAKKLLETLKDRDETVENVASYIFGIYKHYYIPKRKLFLLARNILVLGIITSFIALLFK